MTPSYVAGRRTALAYFKGAALRSPEERESDRRAFLWGAAPVPLSSFAHGAATAPPYVSRAAAGLAEGAGAALGGASGGLLGAAGGHLAGGLLRLPHSSQQALSTRSAIAAALLGAGVGAKRMHRRTQETSKLLQLLNGDLELRERYPPDTPEAP